MNLEHYLGLYPAYGAAMLAYALLARRLRSEKEASAFTFAKPWLEFALAIAAAVLTILIGQLFMKGLLLPNKYVLTASLNQLLIFSPFILLLLLRKHPFKTAWLPEGNYWKSILLGWMLALFAIFVFLLSKGRLEEYFTILVAVYTPTHLPELVQVLMEDFAIAICFFRLSAWIGRNRSIVLIGVLFTLSHIPAMLDNGLTLHQFVGLTLDAGLAVLVLSVLSRSKDILWFWMIHFAMDMMQFL